MIAARAWALLVKIVKVMSKTQKICTNVQKSRTAAGKKDHQS